MAGPARGSSPVAVPPAAAPYFSGPPAAAIPPEPGSAFSPPIPQPGVNPLGGTVAAESPAFPPGPYAVPGAPPPYGTPGALPPYGTPPPGGRVPPGTQLMPGVGGPGVPPYAASPYAPPPGGGTPLPPPPQEEAPGAPNPYGARPPNAYGSPAGYASPAPQGGFAPAPRAPLAPYSGEGGPLASVTPTFALKKRNALLTWLLPLLVIFGGFVLSAILAFITPALAVLGSLVVLAGAIWSLLLAIVMVSELKALTRNEAFAWWPIFVPFYSMYWAWILVPQEVARAKQLRAVQRPPQSIVLYIFLWHFALASDLNDMAP